MRIPLFGEAELTLKFILKNSDNGDSEFLVKTTEWFMEQKLMPREGDIVIPLEYGPAKKPFCEVQSVIWDTTKNEVVFILEKEKSGYIKPF